MRVNNVGDIHALIGKRVRTLCAWSGVPVHAEGVIDEVYDGGEAIMVAWDLPDHPLPAGYCQYDGVPVIQSNITRDGFRGDGDWQWLEIVGSTEPTDLTDLDRSSMFRKPKQ